jgi:hypothetical protein
MKITPEQFDCLPQLDRIEYRQKQDRINKHFKTNYFIGLTNSFFFIMAFIVLSSIGLWNINPEAGINIIALLPLLFKVYVVSAVTFLFIDFYSWFMCRSELKELDEYYFSFKTEVKAKNGKGKR